MQRAGDLLASLATAASIAAPLAAVAWSPITDFPSSAALSRRRYGSTFAISLAGAIFVFTIVQRLTARAAS